MDSDVNASFSRGKSEHSPKKAKESSKRKRSKRDKAEKSSKVGERRRKKSKRGGDKADASHELLQHAAMGKTKLLRQLLDECNSLDLNVFDACGASALHHACRQGHQETAALLLR